ncbi:MAG: VWA domain-containing protein [Pirellulales bacterium]
MAAAELHPVSSTSHALEERDEAIRQAKLRLTHLEIETHRIKADLARLEAWQEDDKADRLSDSLGEPTVRIARNDSPAIFRIDPEQPARTVRIEGHEPSREQTSRVVASSVVKSEPAHREKQSVDRKPAAAVRVSVAKASRPVRQPASRRRFSWRRNSWRNAPPWLVSAVLHVAALLVLMALTFATLKESAVFLTANAMQADESAIPELVDFELEPVKLDEMKFDELPDEISELNNAEFSAEDIAAPIVAEASLLEVPGAADLLTTDLGALMAGMSADGAEDGNAAGGLGGAGAAEASFFGARSRGNRFVFVVDNSGSMGEGRMETTLMELQRSVEALKEDQLFSIIFYSDQVYPMFYPESVEELVPATRENKLKVAKWLPTVQMCLGGRLREAMDLAQQLDPQVVYLLSDGDIRSEPLMQHLTEPNDWKFAIHTFGMTVRNPDHLAKLSAIATSHQGQFVPVSVHPAALQMARQRPIKYHREPGPVWGTKVRPWR